MEIHALPALSDNYIWALTEKTSAIVVDPGQAQPVIDFITSKNFELLAILLTHKHGDHIDGVPELKDKFPNAQIIAPATEGNAHATKTINQKDVIKIDNWPYQYQVYATPGHTSGHLTYADDQVVLCGDALFSCGCGRLFEGDGNDLATAMQVFLQLPDNLQLCCGHEYTLANINFALAVDPDNETLKKWHTDAKDLRAQNKPTLPTTLGFEKQVNPFLRFSVDNIKQASSSYADKQLTTDVEVLTVLRQWKDSF